MNTSSIAFKKLKYDHSSFFSRSSGFFRSTKEIRDIVKIYPDFVRVIKYKIPTTIFTDSSSLSPKSSSITSSQTSLDKSLSRSRSKVRDYILCNNFTHFGTITFDPRLFRHVDLTDITETNKILTQFIQIEQQNHIRKFNHKFGYLLIPEKHKSGAYHYHILLSDFDDSLFSDFFDERNVFLSKYEQRVNAAGGYSAIKNRFFFMRRNMLGRNQFEKIRDKERVSTYILKYITKDFLQVTKNKKRFISSRGLKLPITLYNVYDSDISTIPNSIKILKTPFFEIYESRGLDYDNILANFNLAFYSLE